MFCFLNASIRPILKSNFLYLSVVSNSKNSALFSLWNSLKRKPVAVLLEYSGNLVKRLSDEELRPSASSLWKPLEADSPAPVKF